MIYNFKAIDTSFLYIYSTMRSEANAFIAGHTVISRILTGRTGHGSQTANIFSAFGLDSFVAAAAGDTCCHASSHCSSSRRLGEENLTT